MKFLVIENAGEIEPNAIALMGASTKRGEEDKIGMFGTGTKYAIAVLLDVGIEPVIMAGDLKIRFGLSEAKLKDQTYKQVIMRVGRKETPLSFTTAMGLHWGVPQALRELVSNAMDEGGMRVDVREGVVAKDGVTRILIPYSNQQIVQFYQTIRHWFILDRQPIAEGQRYGQKFKVYTRSGPGVRVYRRGVLVFHDVESQAAYDYDISWLSVREDRTADKWDVLSELAKILDEVEIGFKRNILDTVTKHQDKSLEGQASVQWSFQSKDWAEIMADRFVASFELAKSHPEEISLNRKVTVLPDAWVKALTSDSVKVSHARDLLTTAKLKGYVEIPSGQIGGVNLAILTSCLDILTRMGVYDCGNAPALHTFDSNQMDAPLGEYVKKEDKVLLNVKTFSLGKRQVLETLLEELTHRSSGYGDCTRQFQNAIFRGWVDTVVKEWGMEL